MTRVTLRLPEELHARLRAASQRTGASPNQVIVTALSEAVARDEGASKEESFLMEQVQLIRVALGGLAVELDTGQLPSHLRPGEGLPDRAAFMRSLPGLIPALSETIVAGREDRI